MTTLRILRIELWLMVGILISIMAGGGGSAWGQSNAADDAANPPAAGSAESSSGGKEVAASGKAASKSGEADGQGNSSLGGVRHPLYRLRASDVVEISFTVAPEFNQTLSVQPDGYVTLKDAGMVLAQGLTVPEFVAAVETAYRGYLHDPQVGVVLKEFDRPSFVVGGEVGKPGKYELRGDTTVAEAVQVAGGFTAQSKHSQVVLFRRVNDDLVETRLINVKAMLKKGLAEDTHLRAGDFVFVPKNAISKIAQFLSRPAMSMYVSPAQF